MKLVKMGEAGVFVKGDERMLGEGDFVEQMLEKSGEAFERNSLIIFHECVNLKDVPYSHCCGRIKGCGFRLTQEDVWGSLRTMKLIPKGGTESALRRKGVDLNLLGVALNPHSRKCFQ